MKILFVCTGNTCRSPMAEGIFKELATESSVSFQIDSCGVGAMAGDPPTENAVIACKEIGVDISSHRSRMINANDISETDLFAVMTENHGMLLVQAGVPKNKIYVMNVPDPFGGDLTMYRKCCESIRKSLVYLLERIEGKEEKS